MRIGLMRRIARFSYGSFNNGSLSHALLLSAGLSRKILDVAGLNKACPGMMRPLWGEVL